MPSLSDPKRLPIVSFTARHRSRRAGPLDISDREELLAAHERLAAVQERLVAVAPGAADSGETCEDEAIHPESEPSAPERDLLNDPDATRKKWLRRSLVVMTLVTCGYFAVALSIGFDKWAAALRAINGWAIAGPFALIILGFSIRSARWVYYTAALGWHVPLVDKLTSFVASFSFTATPGKAGELVKALLLRTRHDVSLTEAAGILLVERLGDLLAVALLACGALALFSDLLIYVAVGAVLVGGAGILAAHPSLARKLLERLFEVRRVGPIAQRLARALDAGRTLLKPVPVAIGGTLAIVAWSCEASAFYVLIDSFGIHTSWLIAVSVYGLATLAGALSMLPGGLGGVEVVMVLLLTRLGAAAATATIVMIIFRLLTLWLFSLTGIVFMFGWLFGLSKSPPAGQVLDAR